MDEVKKLPLLYSELADWWPVLSHPSDYKEEAGFYLCQINRHIRRKAVTMLELGSGGGNNASHLKAYFTMTLVDLAPGMLSVSRQLNPECEHIQGDMRSVRLNRVYDIVMIHDAIVYMLTLEDLRKAVVSAHAHLAPGGVALFAPDHVYENFRPETKSGGHDLGNRSLRYLEWTWDPDPLDSRYESLMVYALREGNEDPRIVKDMHHAGLFKTAEWLGILSETGFEPLCIPFLHSEIEPGSCDLFIGKKPE